MKVSVSVMTILYLFLALEILFYSCFTISDPFVSTLAAQRWRERYWHPINRFGYRDVEHNPAELSNRQVIFVVGDSFVAGYGIPEIKNRFSDILQQNLGERYLVLNIAQNGWDTSDEYQAISSHQSKPRKIILSYYVNDIHGAAERLGYRQPVRVGPPRSRIIHYLTSHSYVLNFFYWRLYLSFHGDLGEQYWGFIKNSYANPNIWAAHEAELSEIVTYARNQDIDLTVVIFPYLREVKSSAVITSKVASFFQKNNIRVLNLTPLLVDRDPASNVVNRMDAHPNERLNREVAELLLREIATESE